MNSINLPNWVVFDFLGVIVPLGVRSGLSYMGVHTKQTVDLEIIELMHDLQKQGVLLALASNSGKAWIDTVWQKVNEAPKINALITPEMGAIKPQSEYFEYLVSELNVPAQSLVFIDDRQANCSAAVKAGMRAIWYQGDVVALRHAIGLD